MFRDVWVFLLEMNQYLGSLAERESFLFLSINLIIANPENSY